MSAEPSQTSFKQDLTLSAKGFCMGCADVVPGVSGGTVALIVGIYERLVTAISRIDREFVGFVLRGRFRDAANHIDMRFLVALTLGILTGFVGMTVIMNKLLTNPQFRMVTLAAFGGRGRIGNTVPGVQFLSYCRDVI